jgi:hypothetical protein
MSVKYFLEMVSGEKGTEILIIIFNQTLRNVVEIFTGFLWKIYC